MSRLQKLWKRAIEIRQEEGLLSVFFATCRFLISPIYERNVFYLIENSIKTDSTFVPKVNIDELNFKIVSSNAEADKLEAENFKFRKYPTDFNDGLTTYSSWLDLGAVAFCTFVGNEFAAISWIVFSQRTEDKIKSPPIKIDFANHEAFPRGSWVNPKFRNRELYKYTAFKRDKFLTEKGIIVLRSTIDYTNKIGKGLVDSMGSRVYGQGRWVKILFWRFWEETREM
jgi:hypothetical protein